MDLNEISVFIKIVQAESFTKAARELGMPKSTVSHKVSLLEKRLGVTLIQRTTRKLNITPAGQIYYKKCLSGLEEIQSAELELASIHSEPQGLLRITAPVDIGSNVLPAVVSRYMQAHPKVRVEVILTDRRVDLLSENVDLAIRAGVLQDSSMIIKKIGTTYFVPVASPRYIKRFGEILHPRELTKHNCLQFTPIRTDEWKLVGPKGSLNAALPGRTIINHMDMIREMCLMGDGIALLPTSLVHQDVKSRKLIRLLPDWRSPFTPVHFIYPAQRYVTPKLSSFIEHAYPSLKSSFKAFEL